MSSGFGFTNGCFDILHPGHVRVLTQAVLVLGIVWFVFFHT